MEISLSWCQRLRKSNSNSEFFSSPTRWKSASRGVKDSKNQIENPKFFLVQHGGNQPLVESNTPKIKLKIRIFFKSNEVEIMSGFYAGPPRGCPAPRRPSPTRPSNTAHPPPARPHYRTSSHRFSSHPYRPQSSRHSSLPRNVNRGYYGGERARNNLARNNKGPGHFNNNNNYPSRPH